MVKYFFVCPQKLIFNFSIFFYFLKSYLSLMSGNVLFFHYLIFLCFFLCFDTYKIFRKF